MDFIRGLAPVLGVILFTVLTPTTYAGQSTYDSQWALENKGQRVCRFDGKNCLDGKAGSDIKAQQAWKSNQDCSSIVVAVLDSGVDQRHPDLQSNLLPGKNFVNDLKTSDPQDDNLHGTHVSGIIAGAGSETKGVVGVCRKAKLLPVKVGDKDGFLTDADILEGIQFAVSQNAKVINASFGGGASNQLLKDAMAKASGTLFVVAAGNGDMFGHGVSIDAQPVYPAAYDLQNMVVVAATDSQDRLAAFSNFGTGRVHLAAPGVDIVSTFPMEATEEMLANNIPVESGAIDGTSMATPYVSGAVALLWSTSPRSAPAKIKRRLLLSVDKVPALNGKVQTGGRLNLAKLFSGQRI
ncbi:MAG: S8 family peptidase [Bdellovibrionota bacterium]